MNWMNEEDVKGAVMFTQDEASYELSLYPYSTRMSFVPYQRF